MTLALLALAVSSTGLGGRSGLVSNWRRRDRGSGENICSGSGLGNRSGLSGGSVVILVLGVPLGGGLLIGPSVFLFFMLVMGVYIQRHSEMTYIKLAIGLHLLLLKSNRAQAPPLGVEVTFHDATLDLGDDAVVARGHLDGRHLGNTDGDSLTLGGHQNDLLVNLNTGFVTEETRNHELGTVTDGVDRAVLDNDTLVGGEESLQRLNDLAKVGFVTVVVVHPLSVQNIVQGHHAFSLVHGSTSHSPKLLHVGADTEKQTKVNTQGSDVSPSFTAHPKDTQVALIVELVELALVDGTDTELTLDGRNKRRTLEKRTRKGFQSASELRLTTRQLVVEPDDTDILLSCTLLGFDETSGAVNADDKTSSNLGIEGTTVASLLCPEDPLDPCDDLVAGGVGGLIKIDHTRANVGLQVAFMWSTSHRNGGVVSSPNKH